VRRIDVLITGVLLVLAAWLSVLNIGGDPEVRIDSQSWLQLPVFLAAMLPVLWWRRAPLLAIGASTVVMAAHDLLFGHLVRCGAGLPLAFVFAFLVGLGCDRRKGLVAVGLTIVLAGAVLVWDTAAGPEVLPVVAVILLVLWGIGQVARSRSALGEELRRRNAELAALRDRRAALEVADDRLRVSEQLETLLDARLGDLEAAARSGPDDPREVLQTVEEDSRRTLAEMREIVGTLRGDELALAPVPSVAQL
jgi:signal transduction histidine kinase